MNQIQPFLLEIGTEELPPKSLPKLADELERQLLKQLQNQNLITADAKSKVYATPRRLAIYIDAVAVKQADKTIERKGPALTQAYDDNGEPTQAALGFARSVGLEIDQLQTQKTDKGEWLYCQIQQPGRLAQQILPECVQQALKALPIAKRMRWGDLEAEFIRPVKWIIMLLGSEVVDAEILAVKSDRFSRGHRFHVEQTLRLGDASEYETMLAQEGMVVAEFAQRRQLIEQDLSDLAGQYQASILLDQDLLSEVTGLVELPVTLMGKIDEQFMQLPNEVLISSMQGHQKYFPLVDQQQQLLPLFAFVSNIQSKDQQGVIHGNERVLRARLSDAQFFWDSDRKSTLISRKDSLVSVLFQQRLGSVADKVQRIEQLVDYLAQTVGASSQQVGRAASLCKLDLVSDMVGEFPELQGIMGKYYALADGESQVVADAIEQHYWPKFAGDHIPESTEAQLLAIADKLDTICGLFAIKQIPTGDKDPFALRRQALGILRILIEGELELDLKDCIKQALAGFQLEVAADSAELIYEFIFERLKTFYQSKGYDSRLYLAVKEVEPVSPLDFDKRMQAVALFNQHAEAENLIAANKRISNILQKSEISNSPINSELLSVAAERNLYTQLQAVANSVKDLQSQSLYADALIELTALKKVVDDFFDEVMVMDENLDLRQNRLMLLSQLRSLFRLVADVAHLR